MPTKYLNRGRFIAIALLLGLLVSACAGSDRAKPAPSDTAEREPLVATPAHIPFAESLAPVVDRDGRMVVEAMEYPWSAIGRGRPVHCQPPG